ncbi:keratin-associated protein 6-3-like [Penaeus japonicus]|uniref:keratin-associated protein 6-3-like n=1 Tax=Penaeus japonicus TaxID=27405 RepID=UPI001C70E506|nr:keratin-associated protein 6-3-like [Penaeus japonicus]XP_042891052.1 keratin-associated protein 6-3-like [Penaeus japonicus]
MWKYSCNCCNICKDSVYKAGLGTVYFALRTHTSSRTMARNSAYGLLIVAACLMAAVTAQYYPGGFGQGGFGHGGIGHGGIGHGGIGHGGIGGFGQGFQGSYNPAHFPNLVSGYNFYNHRPTANFGGCKFWCRSITSYYYCCTTGYEG